MNKILKFCLSISCFLPLYVILAFKNVLGIFTLTQEEKFSCQSFQFIYNCCLTGVWVILFIIGIIGLVWFSKQFLKSLNRSKEEINIVSAENTTSEYYFTYFSLFVLTFFTVDPTCWVDFVITIGLMALIIIVYLQNDMYFINPILNLIGYKSFKISYSKLNDSEKIYNVRIFSTANLCKAKVEKYYLSYSPHDFTICYDEEELKKFKKRSNRKLKK